MNEDRQRIALTPGSFDPVTLGHLDVIVRAAQLYDEVVVAILHNPAKAGTFTIEQRIGFIEEAVTGYLPPGSGMVRVEAFAGRLLVDVCAEVGAQVLVKGLRGATDFDYELPMALMNRHLTGIETVFLPGNPALSHISSSLVKEVARFGGDVAALVPPSVREAMAGLGGTATNG